MALWFSFEMPQEIEKYTTHSHSYLTKRILNSETTGCVLVCRTGFSISYYPPSFCLRFPILRILRVIAVRKVSIGMLCYSLWTEMATIWNDIASLYFITINKNFHSGRNVFDDESWNFDSGIGVNTERINRTHPRKLLGLKLIEIWRIRTENKANDHFWLLFFFSRAQAIVVKRFSELCSFRWHIISSQNLLQTALTVCSVH